MVLFEQFCFNKSQMEEWVKEESFIICWVFIDETLLDLKKVASIDADLTCIIWPINICKKMHCVNESMITFDIKVKFFNLSFKMKMNSA